MGRLYVELYRRMADCTLYKNATAKNGIKRPDTKYQVCKYYV